MLKRVSFFILLITILIGSKVHAEEEHPIYIQYVSEITSQFLKQIYKEFKLECEGSGGRMPYDVEEISVMLAASHSATVEEARELEIICTERLAEIVNAHEKIRPFLREYPFPPSRASIAISFDLSNKKKGIAEDEDVVFVFQAKERIFYRARKPEQRYGFNPIKDESYEEASKIVQKRKLIRQNKKHWGRKKLDLF
jgi:hypothetical protein